MEAAEPHDALEGPQLAQGEVHAGRGVRERVATMIGKCNHLNPQKSIF
jgi:hypothetical protein